MLRLLIVFPVFLFLTPCLVRAQDSPRPAQSRGNATIIQPIDCSKLPPPSQGIKTFEDDLTGIRFDYPAYLTLDETDLSFKDPPCGKPFTVAPGIRIEVSLPENYREPFYADRSGLTIETKTLNGLEWKHYTAASDVRMCTIANGEQVCILAADDTLQQRRVPEAAIEAMNKIEASFAFTDPAKRMDAKIAALKAGERVGTLTVRRVVTRAMIRKDPKKYEAGNYESFGEVDFDGEVTVDGAIEDIGTMNSRGQFRIFPDSDNGPQLPLDVDGNLGPGFVFDYPPKLESEVRKCSDDVNEGYVFLLKHLRVIVGPRTGGSEVRADLVSISKKH